VAVRGDVIRAPRIGKLLKMRIRSKLVNVVLETAGRKIDVRVTFHPHDSRCSPSEWRDYWRLLAGVFGDSEEIEFRFESAPHPPTIQVKEREMPNRAQILDEAERMARVSAALPDLCIKAGVVPEPLEPGDVSEGYLPYGASMTRTARIWSGIGRRMLPKLGAAQK
jgi:hypothetical protein